MDDTSIATDGGSLTPGNHDARRARIRWLALVGFVVTALFLGWTLWKLGQGRGLVESDIPPLLGGGVAGLATTALAAIGLRGAGLGLRVGLILLGLCALAAGGWNLFVAWMVAIFPPC